MTTAHLTKTFWQKLHQLRRPSNFSGKSEWLVILPDMPGVLDRRLAIRPKHSPKFAKFHNEGHVTWAGPIFERHVESTEEKRPFKGSVIVFQAEDPAEIMKTIESDPYIREQIWDLEKAEFIPFSTQFRADTKK